MPQGNSRGCAGSLPRACATAWRRTAAPKPEGFPPVTRRLINLATALSLLLSLATSTLWARSYAAPDFWYRETWDGRRGTALQLQSYLGLVRIQFQSQPEF